MFQFFNNLFLKLTVDMWLTCNDVLVVFLS